MGNKKSNNFSEENELMRLVSKHWSVIQHKPTDRINNL